MRRASSTGQNAVYRFVINQTANLKLNYFNTADIPSSLNLCSSASLCNLSLSALLMFPPFFLADWIQKMQVIYAM